MLGLLYANEGNRSPGGQAFEGLSGDETNRDSEGNAVAVFGIASTDQKPYFMPGADPGEGYQATNDQLWGSDNPPASGTAATMQGFVKDFAYTITWETNDKWTIVPGTTADMIMGCFTPETLPVMSALARGYAVCDHWYASAPTETMPNRAFAIAATSQGHMDDVTKTYTCPSIFGALTKALFKHLDSLDGVTLHLSTKVTDVRRTPDQRWRVDVQERYGGAKYSSHAKFVFLGAGGGALPLLQKSGVPEGKGFGGFPVSGQWLRCDDDFTNM